VALLVLRSAWFIARQSAHILMEGAPAGLEPGQIKADLLGNVDGLEDVHHVHTWSLNQERPLVTLHARIEEGADADVLLQAINRRLMEKFKVDHVTVQVEKSACTD
jgi:cobalt-zinc-cadmium efflux system protein